MRLAATGLLVAGATAAPLVLTAGTADAAACGTATPVGTPCTLTGTFTFGAGPLTLTAPGALGWTGAGTGLDQTLFDTTGSHQSYTVNDATGSAAGWHVTLSATTFTSGSNTLPVTAFSTNGSISSQAAITKPTPVCTALATCLTPTNNTTYPVVITTAATAPMPSTIYDTAALTGLGSIVIGGGANPVGWWLTVPANTLAGSYTSTITMAIVSTP